jgi:hypothetical protein
MLNKLHDLEQQAAHAQCLALLTEFITAVRAQKGCIMCGEKRGGAHRPGCATRRADAFIRSTKEEPGNSHDTQRKTI